VRTLIIITLVAATYTGCGGDSKPTIESSASVAPVSTVKNSPAYSVDTSASILNWEGYEGISLGKSEHNGTIKISAGEINTDNTTIVSGEIKFDIGSIVVKDLPAGGSKNAKLTRHLLSEDFFEVSKFPEAKFVITSSALKGADSIIVSGNLTLKGIQKNISFTTASKITGTTITAESPKFYINRKDWGMYYRSENSLGDKLIRPEIGISFSVVARKR